MPPIARRVGLDDVGARRARISSPCSATLVSISPVAIGVSSAAASAAWPSRVVGVERLLDPDQVELLQRPADAQRGRPVPLLVGVHHERHAVAQVLAHRARPARRSIARVRLADLDLDAADAAVERRRGVLQHLLDRRVQEAAGGVVAAHRVAVGAEQLGQRQARALGLQVPQRDVDRGDRLGRRARCGPTDAPAQSSLVHSLRDVVRVLADQVGRDLLGMRVLRRAAGPLGVAEADALRGRRSVRDLGEQEGDLGHRLLPAGQHLGVADRGRAAADVQGDSRITAIRSRRLVIGAIIRNRSLS